MWVWLKLNPTSKGNFCVVSVTVFFVNFFAIPEWAKIVTFYPKHPKVKQKLIKSIPVFRPGFWYLYPKLYSICKPAIIQGNQHLHCMFFSFFISWKDNTTYRVLWFPWNPWGSFSAIPPLACGQRGLLGYHCCFACNHSCHFVVKNKLKPFKLCFMQILLPPNL